MTLSCLFNRVSLPLLIETSGDGEVVRVSFTMEVVEEVPLANDEGIGDVKLSSKM
jgi:hypothetical protein